METLQRWAQGIDLEWLITELFVVVSAVLSLSFHEFSHAYMAKLLGDDTAKRMGRLTLNPFRHISASGLVMLAVFRFGWAKPVPVNMYRFQNRKAGMALTALAGPLSNVILTLLGCFGMQIVLSVIWAAPHFGVVAKDSLFYYLALFFSIFTSLNAGLAVFNLIPISPLDGSKIMAIVLPDSAHTALMKYERYGMLLLMGLLFTGVLDAPLAFLRDGLINGLTAFVRLFFGATPGTFYYR